MILAIRREGAYMDAGELNAENKLDGEGPYRVVPPQKVPSPPDQSSKDSNPALIWPYNYDWAHNAGSAYTFPGQSFPVYPGISNLGSGYGPLSYSGITRIPFGQSFSDSNNFLIGSSFIFPFSSFGFENYLGINPLIGYPR